MKMAELELGVVPRQTRKSSRTIHGGHRHLGRPRDLVTFGKIDNPLPMLCML